jgi:hypothetical protein
MNRLPEHLVKLFPGGGEKPSYAGLFAPVFADSAEVIASYYEEKIQLLELSLQRLNLLENAREIAFLCREIAATKKALQFIHKKFYNFPGE